MALDQLLRQLREKARGKVVAMPAVEVAPARAGEVEPLLGPGQPDVTEASLLLEVALLDRARMRKDALLAADHEDRLVFKALGVVQRHQRDQALAVAQRVLV